MTTGNELRKLLIAVPTTGRRSLRTLITALDRERAAMGFEQVSLLIVTSGPGTYTEAQRLAQVHRLAIIGGSSAGVAHARNAALEEALSRSDDAVVFIDDDEVPEPGWLSALVFAAQSSEADVAFGPVRVQLPRGAPRWLDDGRILRQEQGRNDGRWFGVVYSGNTLVRTRAFNCRAQHRFDERFFSAGEDTVFFEELKQCGHRVVWTSAAIAIEYPDAERLRLAGVLRRSLAAGATAVAVERALLDRRARLVRYVRRCGRFPRGVIRILMSASRCSTSGMVRGLQDIAVAAGGLRAVVGRQRD